MRDEDRQGPVEVLSLVTEILAVQGATAVVRAEARYGDRVRQGYRDLWIMHMRNDGRCSWFEEWPLLAWIRLLRRDQPRKQLQLAVAACLAFQGLLPRVHRIRSVLLPGLVRRARPGSTSALAAVGTAVRGAQLMPFQGKQANDGRSVRATPRIPAIRRRQAACRAV
jgi:hypothetical protein